MSETIAVTPVFPPWIRQVDLGTQIPPNPPTTPHMPDERHVPLVPPKTDADQIDKRPDNSVTVEENDDFYTLIRDTLTNRKQQQPIVVTSDAPLPMNLWPIAITALVGIVGYGVYVWRTQGGEK